MDTNEEIINQVDSVTQLLSDILQDFVGDRLSKQKNTTLVRSLILLTIVELGVLSTIFSMRKESSLLERKVQEPINQLIEMSEQLSSGNLGFRLTLPETLELQTLTASMMNKMAEDLNQSLRENALKQYHLAQSEVRVLQAQITPHFIYNSLDAIISLIEQDCFEEALTMTHALSGFSYVFKQGQDWIPLEKKLAISMII